MNDPGRDLSEIRSMMEMSSKVLSLSGLAGIVIGCVAIAGGLFAHNIHSYVPADTISTYLLADALIVLVIAIVTVIFFCVRMARRKSLPVWSATAKHLVRELVIPLAAGGVFCISLLVHEAYLLLPSAMLVFYGLALFAASKYTIPEVRFLALWQLLLGVIAAFTHAYGLHLWMLGFGVGHVLFGLRIYLVYER